jgi:hypothetical protein
MKKLIALISAGVMLIIGCAHQKNLSEDEREKYRKGRQLSNWICLNPSLSSDFGTGTLNHSHFISQLPVSSIQYPVSIIQLLFRMPHACRGVARRAKTGPKSAIDSFRSRIFPDSAIHGNYVNSTITADGN